MLINFILFLVDAYLFSLCYQRFIAEKTSEEKA